MLLTERRERAKNAQKGTLVPGPSSFASSRFRPKCVCQVGDNVLFLSLIPSHLIFRLYQQPRVITPITSVFLVLLLFGLVIWKRFHSSTCPLVSLRQATVFILFVTTIFCHSHITHFAARGAFIFLRRLFEENNRTPPRGVDNNRLSLVTRSPLECYGARATRIVVLAASLNRPSIFLFTP